MPKLKGHRGLRKRIKVTKNGKVKRHKAGNSHLKTSKNAKSRRNLRTAICQETTAAKKMKAAI